MSEYNIQYELHNMVNAPVASAFIQVMYRAANGILGCYGTSAISVLNAEAANTYAPGCIYQLVSGTSSKAYINIGAADAVATFVPIASAAEAAAATAALTDLTHTAPGTADYAIQDLVQPAGYGFVSKDEGNTVLKVVQANKVNIAEIVAILKASGLMAS